MKLKVFQIECEFEPGESADVLKQVAALLFGQVEPPPPAPIIAPVAEPRRVGQPTSDPPARRVGRENSNHAAAPVVHQALDTSPSAPLETPAIVEVSEPTGTPSGNNSAKDSTEDSATEKPARAVAHSTSRQAVLDDLRTNGPSKVTAISQRLDRGYSLVASQLCTMKKLGQVINDSRNRWWAETDETRTWPRSRGAANLLYVPREHDPHFANRDDDDEPDVVGREEVTQPTEVEHPIPTQPVGTCIPQNAESPMSLFLNELSTPTREVVRLTRSDTPKELAEYGRREFLCRMGAKSHHADEVERWLRGRFKLSFAE